MIDGMYKFTYTSVSSFRPSYVCESVTISFPPEPLFRKIHKDIASLHVMKSIFGTIPSYDHKRKMILYVVFLFYPTTYLFAQIM